MVSTIRGAAPDWRRRLTCAGILAWAPFVAGAAERDVADGGGLPRATDLRAVPRDVPLLVLFARRDCEYCEQVRRDWLVPMSRTASWRRRVRIVQIDVDSDAPLTGFAGEGTSHATFAQQQGMRFTPTVALFDAHGRRLGEPIVGLLLPDYYGIYLERAIDDANARLGHVR